MSMVENVTVPCCSRNLVLLPKVRSGRSNIFTLASCLRQFSVIEYDRVAPLRVAPPIPLPGMA